MTRLGILLPHNYRLRHWFHTITTDAGFKPGDIPNWDARRPDVHEWVLERRRDHDMRVVLAMGDVALQAVRPGSRAVVATRGYVFQYFDPTLAGLSDDAWIVPTLLPEPKQLKSRDCGWLMVENDMRKAMRIADRGAPLTGRFTRILAPTYAQVLDYFSVPRPLVVDIENTKDGRLICIGFCDGSVTLVLPILMQGGGEYWGPTEWKHVQEALDPVFETWPTTYQNGIHDVTGLERAGFHVGKWVLDTMLGHAAVYPNMRHSLHHLGALYCEREPWKNAKQESASPEGELD